MAKNDKSGTTIGGNPINLMTLFTENMAKSKDSSNNKEASFDVMYPTGFLTYDYVTGTMIHVDTPEVQLDYASIGVVDGSSNTFISRPGTGKSTFIVQVIGNMLKMNPGSVAYIDDIEGSLPMSRKEFLLNMDKEELKQRIKFRNEGITTENVYERIKEIHDIKKANASDFMYDTGKLDIYGEKIFKMIPTFYFIDSFAMLMPNDILSKDEIKNGMDAASSAKLNTQLVKKISQLLKEVNIILFTINHIMDDIQADPFAPKPLQVDGLKKGERLPGGRAALYLANNMVRLDKISNLKDSEAFGINGTVVGFTPIKSRTNATKVTVPMIFDTTHGLFDNELSIFYFLKQQGKVKGAGIGLFFEGAEDVKFSMRNFKEKLHENRDLQLAFAKVARETLEELLSDTRLQQMEDRENIIDINSLILTNIA